PCASCGRSWSGTRGSTRPVTDRIVGTGGQGSGVGLPFSPWTSVGIGALRRLLVEPGGPAPDQLPPGAWAWDADRVQALRLSRDGPLRTRSRWRAVRFLEPDPADTQPTRSPD